MCVQVPRQYTSGVEEANVESISCFVACCHCTRQEQVGDMHCQMC